MKRGQAASISWALHFGAAAQEEEEGEEEEQGEEQEEEEGRHRQRQRQRQASPVDSNPDQTPGTARLWIPFLSDRFVCFRHWFAALICLSL